MKDHDCLAAHCESHASPLLSSGRQYRKRIEHPEVWRGGASALHTRRLLFTGLRAPIRAALPSPPLGGCERVGDVRVRLGFEFSLPPDALRMGWLCSRCVLVSIPSLRFLPVLSFQSFVSSLIVPVRRHDSPPES
ncbi:unnamed protein product [Darwinula stevensoni]|uniref:Uncharacterized protein n=1 Tax=Darwinula stevensoni TaxID=69355 RepID=A0A7R8X984_9CRUS|nr:unnamed protein product [Darwinula stevensoni]CAG0885315.1 unnamed protein product [Darwinula stevensoni]